MSKEDEKRTEEQQFLDNLASFLATEDRSRAEVVESLRARGVNPEQLLRDFRALLSEHAPTWMEKAAREREGALRALVQNEKPMARTRHAMVSRMEYLISAMGELGAPMATGAYHQKFQTATDTDLESMLQDLENQYELLKNRQG